MYPIKLFRALFLITVDLVDISDFILIVFVQTLAVTLTVGINWFSGLYYE